MQTVMIFYYIIFFPLILGSMSIFYRLFFLMVRILMTCIYPYAHIYAYKLLCVMLCVCPFVTIVDRPVCVSEPFISMFYQ